jgi:hypothetical protein
LAQRLRNPHPFNPGNTGRCAAPRPPSGTGRDRGVLVDQGSLGCVWLCPNLTATDAVFKADIQAPAHRGCKFSGAPEAGRRGGHPPIAQFLLGTLSQALSVPCLSTAPFCCGSSSKGSPLGRGVPSHLLQGFAGNPGADSPNRGTSPHHRPLHHPLPPQEGAGPTFTTQSHLSDACPRFLQEPWMLCGP